MTDDAEMAEVATEIALWQGSALKLPLSQVKVIAVNGLGDLAASLDAFNQHYLARDRDPQASTAPWSRSSVRPPLRRSSSSAAPSAPSEPTALS
jgi:hypothetical protein